MPATVQLGIVCAALVAGEALGVFFPRMAPAGPIFAAAALFTALFAFSRRVRFGHVPFFFLLGAALMMRATDARHTALQRVALDNGRLDRVFTVTGTPHVGKPKEDGMRWINLPSTFAGEKLEIIITQPATNDIPRIGEQWRCAGWLKTAERKRQLWVRGSGSCATRIAPAKRGSPTVILERIRQDLSRRIGIGLERRPDIVRLHRAMLLGERANLPSRQRRDFVDAGTIHVFAISGLHVTVIAQFILYVLVLMMFPVRWAGIGLFPILGIYTLLIGAPPSAVRAVTMICIFYSASLFWRRPDALTAWEVTLIGFALLDPIGFFGVGSLLSFTVMLGILLFLRWERPFQSRLLTTLGIPFAAWASGVPIAAHVFARITPGGLLANLAIIPIAGLSVLTCVIGVAASFLSTHLASHINNVAALFTQALVGISWAVARLPGATIEILPWPLWMCAAWYVGIILLFIWVRLVWLRRRNSLA